MPVSISLTLAQAGSLFLLTFFSEDAATIGGATLTVTGSLLKPIAFSACFLGIWLGDLGLYGVARYFGRPLLERPWVRRRVREEQLARSEAWLKKRGFLVLLIARFVPGLRLPTYLMAGTLAMPSLFFAATTGIMGLAWVGLIFTLVQILGNKTASWVQMMNHGFSLVLLIGAGLALLSYLFYRTQKNRPEVQRWLQWEFWPAWLFYLPVGFHYLWLGLKYRSFTLPTTANPGIHTGGLVGESKYATLAELYQSSPEFTARSALMTQTAPSERIREMESLLEKHQMTFPVVLKPDVAQRGSGFKIVRTLAEASAYLMQVPGEIVLQEYLAGPLEAGIFYYRFPYEERGRIFAITDKIFPKVTGDGKSTVEQLIARDPRAAIMAATYLQRHGALRDQVLTAGETLKLVEAGNHAQGCIFREGKHLWSEALETKIDEISRRLNGFFIGRYDVRYASIEELKSGQYFKILELNGAASEVTSIYDSRNSLFSAYATLFQQWDLVFAIGVANRQLGHRATPLGLLLKEWRNYQKRSIHYPLAD